MIGGVWSQQEKSNRKLEEKQQRLYKTENQSNYTNQQAEHLCTGQVAEMEAVPHTH